MATPGDGRRLAVDRGAGDRVTGQQPRGLVAGTGDLVHNVVRPWGELLAGWSPGQVSEVAADSEVHVYFFYVDGAGSVSVTGQIPRPSMYSPEGGLLARGRSVAVGARCIWGDSRGNLFPAEVGLHQVTEPARRSPPFGG
jgi:hypothetical protein